MKEFMWKKIWRTMACYITEEVWNVLEECEEEPSDIDKPSESSNDGEINHPNIENLSSDVSDIDEAVVITTSSNFVSQNQKERWSATPHASNTGRTAAGNILREQAGPSRYAKLLCDTV